VAGGQAQTQAKTSPSVNSSSTVESFIFAWGKSPSGCFLRTGRQRLVFQLQEGLAIAPFTTDLVDLNFEDNRRPVRDQWLMTLGHYGEERQIHPLECSFDSS
jgi:hypothetical protein